MGPPICPQWTSELQEEAQSDIEGDSTSQWREEESWRAWWGSQEQKPQLRETAGCQAFHIIDALLITLIKANIWGNQGSPEGGCHSQMAEKP